MGDVDGGGDDKGGSNADGDGDDDEPGCVAYVGCHAAMATRVKVVVCLRLRLLMAVMLSLGP